MTTAILISLTVAMFLAAIRVLRGPTLADRVVALDLMAAAAVGIAIGYYLRHGQIAFLDIAIAIALVSFVATVAFASYLERRSEA